MPKNLEIVFATENPAKLREISSFAAHYGVSVKSPSQAGLEPVSVEETGTNYEENARLKVEPYLAQEKAQDLIICGDDSGVEIEALGGEPGIHTRRWKGYRMTDQEIIEYTLERLKGEQNRRMFTQSVVAYSLHGGPIQLVRGHMKGRIVEEIEPGVPEEEGFPFRQLVVVEGDPEIPLWKFDSLTPDERRGQLSHREMAFLALFKKLQK